MFIPYSSFALPKINRPRLEKLRWTFSSRLAAAMPYRLRPRRKTPAVTRRMPIHSRATSRSPRKAKAKTPTRITLSLSTAATLAVAPICSAPIWRTQEAPVADQERGRISPDRANGLLHLPVSETKAERSTMMTAVRMSGRGSSRLPESQSSAKTAVSAANTAERSAQKNQFRRIAGRHIADPRSSSASNNIGIATLHQHQELFQ